MSNQETQPQRSATRAPVDRPIRLLFDDSLDPEAGVCGNISIGGMFVLAAAGRPAGALARFELLLPEDRVVRGLGEVVWMRSAPEGVEKSAMGIRFRFLEQRDRQMIFKLVSQHIKERLASNRPGELPAHAPPDLPTAPLPASAFTVPPPPTSGPLAEVATTSPEVSTTPRPGSLDELLEVAPAPVLDREAAPSIDDPRPRPTKKVDSSVDAMVNDMVDSMVTGPEAGVRTSPVLRMPDSVAELATSKPPVGGAYPPAVGLSLGTPATSSKEPVAASDLAFEQGSDWAEQEDDSADYLRGNARPRSKGELPVFGILFVALLAVGILAYFFRENLFSSFASRGTAPTTTATTAVAQIGPPADEQPPLPPPSIETPPVAIPPVETAAVDDEAPVAVAPRVSPPSSPPALAPAPSSAAAASRSPREPAFERVADISWHPTARGGTVWISTDGAVREGRFRYFRLEGGSPREVIVMSGVTAPFARPVIEVSSPLVAGLRTGYHRKGGGNEVHVVVDLKDPEARITAYRAVGRRLEVDIQRP